MRWLPLSKPIMAHASPASAMRFTAGSKRQIMSARIWQMNGCRDRSLVAVAEFQHPLRVQKEEVVVAPSSAEPVAVAQVQQLVDHVLGAPDLRLVAEHHPLGRLAESCT